MKKNSTKIFLMIVYISILYLPATIKSQESRSIITFECNGGRLGDDLLSFCKAYWLAFQYDMQLFVPPFHYSHEFFVHEQFPLYTPNLQKQYEVIILKNPADQIIDLQKKKLYITEWKTKVTINWQDEAFVRQLKKIFTPKKEILYFELPENQKTVALHIRTGGVFDFDQKVKHKFPIKFPPIHFYINQLKRLLRMYPDEKFYVHIFTDDEYPKRLVSMIQRAVKSDRITYNCRKKNNHHNLNVLEDLFNMMKFEMLIRPISGLSAFAQRLGQATMIITPKNFSYIGSKQWKIDTVKITIREGIKIVSQKTTSCS